jgi:hypothetical protein
MSAKNPLISRFFRLFYVIKNHDLDNLKNSVHFIQKNEFRGVEKLTVFQPAIIENGSYKRIKVEPLNCAVRSGLAGEVIDKIVRESEEKGFISIPLKLRDMQPYVSLRNTFLERCKQKKVIYVEVFVDDKWNRAFACFDTISLPYDQQQFEVSTFILETELENYYKRLTRLENRRLSLPAGLNPYTRSQHKTNFFILPKQLCFSFYQNQPEIFLYVLNKIHARRVVL